MVGEAIQSRKLKCSDISLNAADVSQHIYITGSSSIHLLKIEGKAEGKNCTSIFSQLQQRGVRSSSCEGQYFWPQNGWALYSIKPVLFVAICRNARTQKSSYMLIQTSVRALCQTEYIQRRFLQIEGRRHISGGVAPCSTTCGMALRLAR